MQRSAIFIVLSLFATSTQATVINVPGDQPTIQAGIDAASNGDTIMVAPGTYTGNLSVVGQNISIISSNGATTTFLKWSIVGEPLITGSNVDSAVLKGFTVEGQSGSMCINLWNCSFVISHNVFRNLSVAADLLLFQGDTPSTVRLERNVFSNIDAPNAMILFLGSTLGIAINNTIDSTKRGIAAYVDGSVIKNNIFTNCFDYGLYNNGTHLIVENYNDFWNNVVDYRGSIIDTSDITADPQFVNRLTGDYELMNSSPCIDRGDPDSLYNDPDGSHNDIGVFSYTGPIVWYIAPFGSDSTGDGSESNPFATVQYGIDFAVGGDTVIVADGTYYERISFLGKSIVVGSWFIRDNDSLHVLNTIIDADTSVLGFSDTGCAVIIANNEDTSTALIGLTITGGTGQTIGVLSFGGGIYSSSGASIIKCILTDNIADYGGGLAIDGKPNLDTASIYECLIINNVARVRGGGVSLTESSGTVTLSNCQISDNTGDGIFGGNVRCRVNNCTLSNNSTIGARVKLADFYDCVLSGNGSAGFFAMRTFDPHQGKSNSIICDTLQNCLIENNGGFGLWLQERDLAVFNTIIRSNVLGGIRLDQDGLFHMEDCTISDHNTAEGAGLIFPSDCGPPIFNIIRTTFLNNHAIRGGAIKGPNFGSVFDSKFEECVFRDNVAVIGGAAHINKRHVFRNCTFVGNHADTGSAIYFSQVDVWAGPSTVENSLFAFNTGSAPTSSLSLEPDSVPQFSCTNIFGNDVGDWIGEIAFQADSNGNFSLNPLFCDTALDDHTLKNSSPCSPENNACSVLVGALGVACANDQPLIVSGDSLAAVACWPFSYNPDFVDADGPDTIISYVGYPSWLTVSDDTIAGTPSLTDQDTSFTVIVFDGFLADSQLVTITVYNASPIISALSIDNQELADHIISHNPEIAWTFLDTLCNLTQSQFEIAVGTDSDWAFAEMWNPSVFVTPDTFVTYAGATLVDSTTYYMRLRVHNGIKWSPWHDEAFHMNALPTVPILDSPINGAVVGNLPTLELNNSSDFEGDTLWYDFEVYGDSDLTVLEANGSSIPGWISPTQTTWQVNTSLTEDAQHWWRARAYDGYEYSDWTLAETFWVNATNSAPSAFAQISPPDSADTPVFNMKPTFVWSEAADPDPFDTVRYKLELAIDSAFLFALDVDSLTDTIYVLTDSLEFSTRYWWRVTAFDLIGNQVTNPFPKNFWTWTLGDVDHSHLVDIADLTYLVAFMFGGGAPVEPLFVADVNGDCSVDISDLTYFVAYMFGGGPEPKVGCE